MTDQDFYDHMQYELASLQRWIRIAQQQRVNCPTLAFALASVTGWLREYKRGDATVEGWLAASATANHAVDDYLVLEWELRRSELLEPQP